MTYAYYATDDSTCATSPTTCPHRKGDLWKVTNAVGQVTEYLAYDGAGRVLSNTYTLYDENGQWLGDYDNNGAVVQQAIWLDDLPVGVLAKTTLRYVQPDHLGTPRAVIDPVRDVAIWRWDLKGEAFGTTAPDQDPDKDGTVFVFDMRFPGQRYDALSGLNQNYFRDYEPGTGRYVQSDPIGLDGGISAYSYVGADPASYLDPLGLLRFHPGVKQKYPNTVSYINGLKERMTPRKYEGFARFGRIGKDHLDHLLDPCDGPVITPKFLRHESGTYKRGTGDILIHSSYFDRYEAGDRSDELLRTIDATVEHELVHFSEYFWNRNRSTAEEGWQYENFVYGTPIPH